LRTIRLILFYGLHRGFDRPDKTYEVGRQQQTSKGLTGVLGFISGHPVATATFAYGKSDQTMVDATDTKVRRHRVTGGHLT
jgi:hypothetical protein